MLNSIINITVIIKSINEISSLSDKELQEELEKMITILSDYRKAIDVATEEENSKTEDIQLYVLSLRSEISDRRMRAYYNKK